MVETADEALTEALDDAVADAPEAVTVTEGAGAAVTETGVAGVTLTEVWGEVKGSIVVSWELIDELKDDPLEEPAFGKTFGKVAAAETLAPWLTKLEELLDDPEAADGLLADPEATTGALAILVTWVVVVVVLEPGTHFPFTRMSPNLLEQLLQAIPPSL